jgi:hypothetical protein
MAALSTIHDVTGRRLVSAIYSWDIYALHALPIKKIDTVYLLGRQKVKKLKIYHYTAKYLGQYISLWRLHDVQGSPWQTKKILLEYTIYFRVSNKQQNCSFLSRSAPCSAHITKLPFVCNFKQLKISPKSPTFEDTGISCFPNWKISEHCKKIRLYIKKRAIEKKSVIFH